MRPLAATLPVVGFAVATLAFMLFLTINGASGVTEADSELTVVLVVFGLFAPAAGMFRLSRNSIFSGRMRRGLVLEGIGLASLFFGILLAVATSSLTGFLTSVVVLSGSALSTLAGAVMLRATLAKTRSPQRGSANLHLVGLVLLLSGTAIIVAFNIFSVTYYVSNLGAIIYEDIGATVSAYGAALGSYSFLRLFR